MPRGYGIGYGSIGPNPWASANAAQYLGPGSQFQTLAGAPGSAGQYWSSIRPPGTPTRPRATPAGPALKQAPKKWNLNKHNIANRLFVGRGAAPRPTPTSRSLKPVPKGTYQQPRNPVVPAGDPAPYKGSEAPIAAPSKGGTLRITGFTKLGGGFAPVYGPKLPVQRITVPQDATQTRQQVKGGRKQIKLPEPEALAAIGGAGLLLVLL